MAMTVNNSFRLVSNITGEVAYTVFFATKDFALGFEKIDQRAIELIDSKNESYHLYLATNIHMKIGSAKLGEVVGIYNHITGQLEDY